MSTIEFTEEDLVQGAACVDVVRAVPYQKDARILASEIAYRHGLRTEEMLGRSRHPHVVDARCALYRALRALGWSYPAIARFADRDHTTIMAAVRREVRRGRSTGCIQ